MSNWVKYQNGNYTVSIDLDTGTKIRENELDYFEAAFPESMDLKITNRCHNGCSFCHENSTMDGCHGDILAPSFIDHLHPYTEIAIGGGNPLEHPDLIPFLEKLKELKMISSMTIRQNDFMDNLLLIKRLVREKLIYGLGVSLIKPDSHFIQSIKELPNAVIHVINGVVPMQDLKMLAHHNLKILVLGYKQVRRGEQVYEICKNTIENHKNELYELLPEMITDHWFSVISFDNLSINQLNPQRLMSNTQWDQMYMGDDGIDGQMTSASMFIDMVERKFAKNSCDMHRYPIMDSVESMFNYLKKS